MFPRSLGLQTDLIFPRFDGEVLDRGDYLVVRTPSNPTFYWGNFLIFPSPPKVGDDATWEELFLKEIGPANHRVFAWDSPEGEEGAVNIFTEADFRIERLAVLTCSSPIPPRRPNREVEVRPLQSDSDWEQSAALKVMNRNPVYDEAGYLPFAQRQGERHRRMVAAGLGTWFGAFVGQKLVGELGLFSSGSLARFQVVSTHVDHRRQGICGTLVYEASLEFLRNRGTEKLVIAAEPGEDAIRVYQSLGFKQVEWQQGVEKSM